REGPAEEFAPAGVPALAAAGAPAPLAPSYPGQPAFAGVGAPPPPPVNMPAPAGGRRVPPQLPHGATIGLLHTTGASVGTNVIRLPRSRPFRIGRAKESELRLFDARISRQHALIDYDPRLNSFIVTDLSSGLGVYVNSYRIDRPTVLRNGDRLEIGNLGIVTFSFESQPDPRYAAAPLGMPAG
ncbi:MAG TPA: FHA domain-containing protein, partial [Thermomicrobiales bacterium]|nr:FHA domain-containing protein [Thermomicrobiales bacterium]